MEHVAPDLWNELGISSQTLYRCVSPFDLTPDAACNKRSEHCCRPLVA